MDLSLKQLLRAQARIARLGERSQNNWWNSDAHSRAGGLLLTRLFPRTATWSAVELAIDAAVMAHRQNVPPIPTITLYNLGETVNRALSDLLLQKKLHSEAADPFLEPLTNATELAPADQFKAVQKAAAGLTPDRTVCVGDIPATADMTDPSVWRLLVAGYQFSAPGRLVVPYLRLV